MTDVDREIDRALLLLRNKIRERGFTQLEVQQRLHWGRSYVSQLLTKQKSLRLEQLVRILDVLGVERAQFFSELYPPSAQGLAARSGVTVHPGAGPGAGSDLGVAGSVADLSRSLRELRSLVRGLANLLVGRGILAADELEASVRDFGQEEP